MRKEILINFYCAIIKNVLSYAIVVWGGASTGREKDKINTVIKTASKITGSNLSSVDDIFRKRLIDKAKAIIKDKFHPGHDLLGRLPSGRRFRSYVGSSRFLNSMYPSAVRLLNETT